MRSACPGYMKSKSKMNRNDETTSARRDGVGQVRVQTVGAPQQNLTAGRIGNTPLYPSPATTTAKVVLALCKVLGVSFTLSLRPAPLSNTKVNWHNLWHHHHRQQQLEVTATHTLIET